MPRLMVTRPITPSFSRVDSADEVQHYRMAMLTLWRGRTPSITSFPGCNPCSLSRDALRDVLTHTYVIALKSDGVRYALYLTLRPDGEPIALMVDRAWNMFEVEVVAPAAFFERGTILEGELVWQQPEATRLVYLIFDGIVVKGRNLTTLPFGERLMEANACTRMSSELATAPDLEARALETDSIVMVHYEPELLMRPKTFVGREHIAQLWAKRRDIDHRVDGVILHRYATPYHVGTAQNHTVLKWKDAATVDLRATTPLGTLQGPLQPTVNGLTVVVEPSRLAVQEGEVVEYLATAREGTLSLFAMRTRPDKSGPNSLHVVEATVRDLVEAISVDEIAAA